MICGKRLNLMHTECDDNHIIFIARFNSLIRTMMRENELRCCWTFSQWALCTVSTQFNYTLTIRHWFISQIWFDNRLSASRHSVVSQNTGRQQNYNKIILIRSVENECEWDDRLNCDQQQANTLFVACLICSSIRFMFFNKRAPHTKGTVNYQNLAQSQIHMHKYAMHPLMWNGSQFSAHFVEIKFRWCEHKCICVGCEYAIERRFSFTCAARE